MNDYLLKKSQEKRKIAEKLLKENQVLNILKKYSDEVYLLGSYELDLMYDANDIDIKVFNKNKFDTALKIFNNFAKNRFFQKMEFGDFEKFKRENRPEGFIINLKKEFKGEKWEIEIWILDEKDKKIHLDDFYKIKEKLTEEKRIEILKAKSERLKNNQDKNDLNSYEIYKKILGL